ncbi:hypothetical protein CALCODRAFT_517952 [Calocera cornea HHB12733]|uniref:Uncharacterized protein n=1 Tax=Calocera cornea HHB12733 TaxID=1353952 RepID=A0A165FGW3_9BASI|nr:hypothetical protein CALCODRAFT_517952 [Calocera cornea HHB12733]
MSSAASTNSTEYDSSPIAVGGTQNALLGGLAMMGLYGVHFVLFCATVYVLCIRPKRQINWVLLVSGIFVFIFTSMDLFIECHRLLIGLLYMPVGPVSDAYFNSGGDWPFGLQDTVRVINVLIADAVLTYRVWCVWERRWYVVIFNILCWLATVVTSIRILQLQIFWIETPVDFFYLTDMTKWSLATQCLTLAQTVTATALIGFRRWQIDSVAYSPPERKVSTAGRILVESAILYTGLMACNVGATAPQNPGLFVILSLMSPIIGISLSGITIRVALGLSSDSKRNSLRPNGMTTGTGLDMSGQRDKNSQHTGDDDRTEWDGQDSVGLQPMSRGIGAQEAA